MPSSQLTRLLSAIFLCISLCSEEKPEKMVVKQYLLGSTHSISVIHLSHLAWRSQKDDRYVTSLVLSSCSNTLLKLRINYLEKPINKSIKCLPSTEPKDVILIKRIFKWTESIYDIGWCCSFVLIPSLLPTHHFTQSTPTATQEDTGEMHIGRRTYLWTNGNGRKLRVDVISSPQSNMMVVDLNLSTLQGKVGCPDRQYCKNMIRMLLMTFTNSDLPSHRKLPFFPLIFKHAVSYTPE